MQHTQLHAIAGQSILALNSSAGGVYTAAHCLKKVICSMFKTQKQRGSTP
jgi:hypothetical protein